MSHSAQYLSETSTIAGLINSDDIEAMVRELVALRERGGRLFLIGLGGSAANCSHAVNDFRKLCGIEAYTPVDNVAELTARANDEGWDTIFSAWVEKCSVDDALFVLSVGGGHSKVSLPLVTALGEAKERGLKIFGIVGRNGGATKKLADSCVMIPMVKDSRVTPHTEGWQSVILHCIVSHPDLQIRPTKW